MRRLLVVITTLLLIFTLTTSMLAQEKIPPDRADNTYFIAFKSKVDTKVIKDHGGKLKNQYQYIPVVAAKLPDKAIEALSKNPNIDYIEKDAIAKASSQVIPWGIPHVKATNVQDLGNSGKGIKIGIIDTGIDDTHEDLKVNGGATFVEGTTDFKDDNGHGTHVAGTIAALDNEIGIIGVAPQAEIYAIKALDQSGSGNYSDIVAGIEWAITNKIDIVNMSLGEKLKAEHEEEKELFIKKMGELTLDVDWLKKSINKFHK
ncbi:S8 family serine peptidase [Tepidibacillus infernus]|uniref:S8 family serine peptidase n=1 Tax=Tepidibacillus infernus TaxID=1806172 RepID=UPI003A32F194